VHRRLPNWHGRRWCRGNGRPPVAALDPGLTGEDRFILWLANRTTAPPARGCVDGGRAVIANNLALRATATVLTGPPNLPRMFYLPPGTWEEHLGTQAPRLRDRG